MSDLLKRLVDFDGFGCPSRMHDENDGPGAAAAGIAAIGFADGDYSVAVGVDDRPGMHPQFMRSVSSSVEIFRGKKRRTMRIRQPDAANLAAP